jgi:hypothetical protein
MIDQLKEEEKIDFEVQILPKPTITMDDNELDLNRGTGNRKKRTLKNKTQEQREVEKTALFPGEQPLNWVKSGIEQLHVYNEVWTIFDKDGHPKTAEAFEMAENTEVEGKKLRIAFSSRCFEYYLLLHFELIYKAFEKSECNGKEYYGDGRKSKTVSYHCMTPRAIEGKACQGDKCINGYARLKRYWKDSKGSNSTFALVADKLWIGICNAHTIRWQSNLSTPETPIYERNPYVDTDKLTCRLMGYGTIEHGDSHLARTGNNTCHISREQDTIMFTLESETTIIIPSENIVIYNNLTHKSHEAGIRLMLTVEEPEQQLDLLPIMPNKDEYCIITLLSKSYFCALLPDHLPQKADFPKIE